MVVKLLDSQRAKNAMRSENTIAGQYILQITKKIFK